MQTLTLSPLFSKQLPNGTIQLLARDKDFQYLINVNDIVYHFYIGKLPGWESKKFLSFLKERTKGLKLSKEDRVDSESFVFNQPWEFYKVYGDYKSVTTILNDRYSKFQINYKRDNYFLRQFTGDILNASFNCSELYYDYWQEFTKIDLATLKGVDRLYYYNLRYPFRYVGQGIHDVQIKHGLNFQDTLTLVKCEIHDIPNSTFKYDKVVNVKIQDIKNVQSTMTTDVNHYKVLMYDIENVVAKEEEQTFVLWNQVRKRLSFQDPFFRKLVDFVQKAKKKQVEDDSYEGLLDINSKDSDFKDRPTISKKESDGTFDGKCCDQNEIVCISFIVTTFGGSFLKKIALVRSEYEVNPDYADEVIVAKSEKELLIQAIKILGCKDYNMIMGFNNWAFDMVQLMIRFLMHGLAKDFISAMDMKNEFNPYNVIVDGSIKITGSLNEYGLLQVSNPLRFDFDVLPISKIMNTEMEKMDSKGLNAQLEYNGLESKQGITYQQITDRFVEHEAAMKDLMDDGYSYEQIQEMLAKM